MKSFFYAFRYIIKSPAAQFVKIVSLTLGLAAGLLIFAKVAFERSYDSFFPDADRVYQMKGLFTVETGGKEDAMEGDLLFAPMAPYMAEHIPAIESATRLYPWYRAGEQEFFYDGEFYRLAPIMADTALFSVLDYGLVQGDRQALADPQAVLLSESAARMLFGGNDPIGQTILYRKKTPLTVRGIFRDLPANSSAQFDVVASLAGMKSLLGWSADWNSGDSFFTYVKLRRGASVREVEEAVVPLFQDSPLAEMIRQYSARFTFHRIDQSHMSGVETRQITGLLLWLAVLVLFISAMNYVLVSISSLDRRTRAIAVQKCNGARENTIFGQFLIETAILILFSLALTVFLFFSFRGQIEHLASQPLSALFEARQWGRIGAIVVGFFGLAGVIPGRIFSRIPVTYAFSATSADKRWWKQLLIFAQLVCATFVLIFLLIVVRQYNLVANRAMGYDYAEVVSAEIRDVNAAGYERIRQELSMLPWVENTALSNAALTSGLNGQPVGMPDREEMVTARRLVAEPGFLHLMDIPLRYGEDFPESGWRNNTVIVNEKLVDILGWERDDAVGKTFDEGIWGNREYEVIGVTADFHTTDDASEAILPVVIHPVQRRDTTSRRGFEGSLHIRLNGLTGERLNELQATLQAMLPDQPVVLSAYAERIRETSAPERLIRNLVVVAAGIIFLITLTGLVGYVNDEVRRRRREIAIRKVHGATVADIIRRLARSLMVIGTLALAAGTAGAWVAATNFVHDFPVQISLSAWSFIAGAGFVLLVCGATIVLRSWRAANENPSKTIKEE